MSRDESAVRIRLTCVGIKPILMDPAEKKKMREILLEGKRELPDRESTPEQIAARKIYRDPEGNISMPSGNFFRALIFGGRNVPLTPKKNMSTLKTTEVPSFIYIEEPWLEWHGDTEWIVDERKGRNPKDGTAMWLVRPMFLNWGFSCTLVVNLTRKGVTMAKVKELVSEAGLSARLGAFRQEFGLFRIATFEKDGVEGWKVLD